MENRVLNIDRSHRRFRSPSLTILREISSEKEFDADEDQIFKSLSTLLIIRVDSLRFPHSHPPSRSTIVPEIHGHGWVDLGADFNENPARGMVCLAGGGGIHSIRTISYHNTEPDHAPQHPDR